MEENRLWLYVDSGLFVFNRLVSCVCLSLIYVYACMCVCALRVPLSLCAVKSQRTDYQIAPELRQEVVCVCMFACMFVRWIIRVFFLLMLRIKVPGGLTVSDS